MKNKKKHIIKKVGRVLKKIPIVTKLGKLINQQ